MSAAAIDANGFAAPRAAAANPWLIAIVVALASFMEVLDTTIANVALPYIAGGMGVSADEASWVVTTYLVSNAIILTASSFLARMFGRKTFFLICLGLFTLSSVLCGFAPNLDALYFTMLNSNKRSLSLNTKTPEGKAILERLIREADVLVENFAPGAMDRMGFTWERIRELDPRIIFGSIKGFSEGSPTRTSRCTKTWRNAPAARLPLPASGTDRRPSAAWLSATATPGCIWRSAF